MVCPGGDLIEKGQAGLNQGLLSGGSCWIVSLLQPFASGFAIGRLHSTLNELGVGGEELTTADLCPESGSLFLQDLGLEGTVLNDVLYKKAAFVNLVDPISHDLLMSLARDLQCPQTVRTLGCAHSVHVAFQDGWSHVANSAVLGCPFGGSKGSAAQAS